MKSQQVSGTLATVVFLLLLSSRLAVAGNVINSVDDGRTGWYPDAGYITTAQKL